MMNSKSHPAGSTDGHPVTAKGTDFREPLLTFHRPMPDTTGSATSLSIADLVDYYAHPAGLVRTGFITTLDGALTGPDGRSGSLGTPLDKIMMSVLRYNADVVIIGADTVRQEGYGELGIDARVEEAVKATAGAKPVLAVVTGSGLLTDEFLQRPDPAIIITTATGVAALATREVPTRHTVAVAPESSKERVSVSSIDAILRERGLTRHLLEGGPTLLRNYLAEGMVHEWCLTTSARVSDWPHPKRLPSPGGAAASGEENRLPTTLQFSAVDPVDSTLIQRWSQNYLPREISDLS